MCISSRRRSTVPLAVDDEKLSGPACFFPWRSAPHNAAIMSMLIPASLLDSAHRSADHQPSPSSYRKRAAALKKAQMERPACAIWCNLRLFKPTSSAQIYFKIRSVERRDRTATRLGPRPVTSNPHPACCFTKCNPVCVSLEALIRQYETPDILFMRAVKMGRVWISFLKPGALYRLVRLPISAQLSH